MAKQRVSKELWELQWQGIASSFEGAMEKHKGRHQGHAARKQLRRPTETVRGAAGGRMAKQRNAVESCREGFEAFKAFNGCWKRAR